MSKLKVLHLITHLGIGGAQDNTLLTVKGHSRANYDVHLAAGKDYTEWEDKGRAYADAFFSFPDLCRSVQPQTDMRALNQLTAFFKENQYDIVHTHSSKAGILGRIAARRAHVPYIVHTFHGFGWQVARTAQANLWQELRSSLKEQAFILLERYVALKSDALITVCELNKQEIIKMNLAPAEKFTTVYSGIDLNRFKVNVDRVKICESLGLNPDQPIIGTIGRLSVQKAPLDFVKAAKLALQQKPELQFIMIGDGPLATDVAEAIGHETRIKVFGYRSDIPEILATLKIFALSSLWEGLGRAMTEAMIMGVPVAATAVDGVPELVKDQQTGLLSDPGNPTQLAENILWFLDNPTEAEAMSRRAKASVIPTFSAEKMVADIEALYEQLQAAKEQPVLRLA